MGVARGVGSPCGPPAGAVVTGWVLRSHPLPSRRMLGTSSLRGGGVRPPPPAPPHHPSRRPRGLSHGERGERTPCSQTPGRPGGAVLRADASPVPLSLGSEDCRQARGEDTREGKPVIADSEDAAGVSSERRLATGGGGGQEQGAAQVSRPRAAGLRLAQGQHHLWAVQGGGTPPCPPPSRGLSNLSPVKARGPHPSLRHLYFPASPKPQRM